MADAATAVDPPAASRIGPSGLFAAFEVSQYARLWAGGWLGNLTRPMTIFISTYTVNALTDSALLVQAVGAIGATPMLLGGALGGAISDRLDRRLTIMAMTAFMVPCTLVMAAIALAGALEAWMVYRTSSSWVSAACST